MDKVGKAASVARVAVLVRGDSPETDAASSRSGRPKLKKGSAASVVAQSRVGSGAGENIASLDRARLGQTRLHISKDLRDIRVEFPGPDREPFFLDLSFLSAAPHLANPLAQGFRIYGVSKRQKTVMGRRSELQTGFMAFLKDKGLLNITLEDLDRSLWNQFKQWLDTKVPPNKRQPILPKTRSTTFGALVVVLESLKSVPEFSRLARTAYDSRPSVTWDSAETRTTARERLSLQALRAIDSAISKDIELLRQKVDRSEILLQKGCERIAARDIDFFDLATCAAWLSQEFPNGLPSVPVIKKMHPNLHPYVAYNGRNSHSILTIKELLYPEARDLVPLVIFLAIESAYNPTTLFELEWSDIQVGECLGEPVVRLGGVKSRGSIDPAVPLPAARTEPILDLVKRLTMRVRATVSNPLKDRLFLFSRLQGTTPAGRGFGGDDRGVAKTDSSWRRGLKEFCQDHGLEPFTLSQIRATIGDEIAFREGIVVAAQVLGHQGVQTTERHYVSDGTRWREAEYLGSAMLFRERWFRTNGKIDPRRRRLTPRMDRGAATPGFHCLDPYDSPWPMQRKGRLCTAYGRCPSCPLAAADTRDAGAVALYLALRSAIFDAQGRIPGEGWLERYGQVLMDLDALLKHVAVDVMKSAERFHVNLPPVE